MAISFVRAEFVGRSSGKNACQKAAYNSRSKIYCERTGQTFDYSHKADNFYHKILLPEYVNEKYKNPASLSNLIEATEKREDS